MSYHNIVISQNKKSNKVLKLKETVQDRLRRSQDKTKIKTRTNRQFNREKKYFVIKEKENNRV